MNPRATSLLAALLALALAACTATYDEKLEDVRAAYLAGNLAAARSRLIGLQGEIGKGHSYKSCLDLEEAIVRLAGGDAAGSEEILRRVRDELDEVERKETAALFGEMATYFTDDRAKAYSGEDYEKLLIRVMLAFSNLLRGGEDVVAYANQVLEKQREIIDEDAPDRSGKKYKSKYKRIGAGAYVYGLVTEARDPTAGSEAAISYGRVKEWEPQFEAIDRDIQRARESAFTPTGEGAVYVFAFAGRGPRKIEVVRDDEAVASEIVLQMSRFIPQIGKHYGATLDLSPIKVPAIRRDPANEVRSIHIAADGKDVGPTDVLTNITETALQHYSVTKDWLLAKALLRRMVKKAIVTAAKGTARAMTDDGDRRRRRDEDEEEWRRRRRRAQGLGALIEIGGIIANTAWSAIERADTRGWTLLPDTIQCRRIELPAGEHEIVLTPEGSGRGVPRATRVEVVAGDATYIFAFAPTLGPWPAPLTNRPARGGRVEP